MDISLAYIEGISSIDTPYFANISEQDAYFDRHEVATINTTYYPPHYQNVIDVDEDDCDFNTSINYLWLTFLDKRYYYFIDNIEYVSESLIKLHISMDVIQTYFFNLHVFSGYIERKFIDRFNGPSINRDYLRENVSKGEFIIQPKQYLVDSELWVVMKVTELPMNDKHMNTIMKVSSDKNVSIPYWIMCYPLNYRNYSHIVSKSGTSTIYDRTYSIALFSQLVNYLEPYVIDKYITRICPVNASVINNEIVINDNSSVFIYSNNDWMIKDNTYNPPSSGTGIEFPIPILTTSWQETGGDAYCYIENYYEELSRINFDSYFQKNTLISSPYNAVYEPILLDENYIRIEFGNNDVQTTYPLYKATVVPSFTPQYFVNFDSGIAHFGLEYSTSYPINRYSTVVDDVNIPLMDIMPSSENTYIANNRNRWITAGIGVVSNVVDKFKSLALGTLSVSYLSNQISDIPSKVENLDKRTKKYARLKQSKLDEISSLTYKKQREELGMIPSSSVFSPLIEESIRENNAMYVPDKPQQISTATSKLTVDGMRLWYRIIKVDDYNQCARYFATNGYLVNQFWNHRDQSIFDYVNTRFRFNVLKMKNPIVHLRDVIEDDETVNLIASRLTTGLRLWNNKPTTTNYSEQFSVPAAETEQFILNVGDNPNIEIEIVSHTGDQVIVTAPYYESGEWFINITNGTLYDQDVVVTYSVKDYPVMCEYFYDNIEKSLL